jgi:hypothetical protein
MERDFKYLNNSILVLLLIGTMFASCSREEAQPVYNQPSEYWGEWENAFGPEVIILENGFAKHYVDGNEDPLVRNWNISKKVNSAGYPETTLTIILSNKVNIHFKVTGKTATTMKLDGYSYNKK